MSASDAAGTTDASKKRPRIVISCGDVNGIGIECLVGALRSVSLAQGNTSSPLHADLSLCIDVSVLSEVLRKHNIDAVCKNNELIVTATSAEMSATVAERWATHIALVDINTTAAVNPGACAADAGAVAIASLNCALARINEGDADAILTLPISKDACKKAGWPYPGHTELLAERAMGEALMLLCHESVRVGLVTAHVPLRYVADTLNEARVEERIVAMHNALQSDFDIAAPHIAVLGLNPHAGEEGLIGKEEQTAIAPAIANARTLGINAEGPFPSDGFFAFGAYKGFDGILAMYHDQGLIPLKLLAHGGGVNVTANLTIVRTSPDHGTAFGIAGQNKADASSTAAALSMGIDIVLARKM